MVVSMQREATTMNVRQNLGEFLNQVQYRGDSVVVTKHGKPVAALVDYALYERIRRLSESFVALTDKLGQVNADVPTETADAEIDAAVRSVRQPSQNTAMTLTEENDAHNICASIVPDGSQPCPAPVPSTTRRRVAP
jgi:prevent-host-death family protein